MNHQSCHCGTLSGPPKFRIYAGELNGCGGGVYGNGATFDEALSNVKIEMRDHRQKLRDTKFYVIDLAAEFATDPVLNKITRPKRWAEVTP